MIVIETCPRCGADLEYLQIETYPPISVKRCTKCTWFWEGKREAIIRIPFKEDVIEINHDINTDNE